MRDTAAGDRAAAGIRADVDGADVGVERLDLLDLGSISAFVRDWSGPLDLLFTNAGVMALPELRRTDHGWETQFATNHLGHFALATGLHDALAAAGSARVVSVSSSGHLRSPVVFEDLHFTDRAYDPWLAYGQSKTANVLFAVEATRRWADHGITANALMPGGIMTNLQRHVSREVTDRWEQGRRDGTVTFKTPQQGAATSLVAAVAPQLDGIGSLYLEDCEQAPTVDDDAEASRGVRRWALDPDAARRLWEVSSALLEDAGQPVD